MQLAKLPRQKGRIPVLRHVRGVWGKREMCITQCAVCVTNVYTYCDQALGSQ